MTVCKGSDTSVLPPPETAAARAAARQPGAAVHIGCPNRDVSLCRAGDRTAPGAVQVAAGPTCVVCLDLASKAKCPDCGQDHRLPESIAA